MSEPMTPERLDELVDTDPIRLKEITLSLLIKAERLRAELAELQGQNTQTEVNFNNYAEGAILRENELQAQLDAVWALAEPWRSADFVSASLRNLVYGLLSIRDRADIAAESSSPTEEKGEQV